MFWPGEFHGLYSPRGPKESGTTEPLSLSLFTCAKYRRKEAAPQTWRPRQMVRATVFQRGKCHTPGVLIQGKSAPPRGTHVTMSSCIFACHGGGRCTGYWHLVGGSHTEQPQQQRFIHPKGVTRRCACLRFSIFPYNSCPKFQ